jgi:RNA polymerase sigma-70 factor, ECF subfamily
VSNFIAERAEPNVDVPIFAPRLCLSAGESPPHLTQPVGQAVPDAYHLWRRAKPNLRVAEPCRLFDARAAAQSQCPQRLAEARSVASHGRANLSCVTIPQVLSNINRGSFLFTRGATMSGSASDDRGAKFVQLLAMHEHRIGSYVLALMPNWTDAEEIIQQTKLRLWEQFDAYDPTKDFGVWACVIAHYEVLTYRTRAARSRVQFSQELVDRLSGELPQIVVESDSRLPFIERCLKKLTQWQRDLLWRCCVAGDSTQKVASQLGRKAGATRQALLRIRRTLYRCIEDAQQEEADRS